MLPHIDPVNNGMVRTGLKILVLGAGGRWNGQHQLGHVQCLESLLSRVGCISIKRQVQETPDAMVTPRPILANAHMPTDVTDCPNCEVL